MVKRRVVIYAAVLFLMTGCDGQDASRQRVTMIREESELSMQPITETDGETESEQTVDPEPETVESAAALPESVVRESSLETETAEAKGQTEGAPVISINTTKKAAVSEVEKLGYGQIEKEHAKEGTCPMMSERGLEWPRTRIQDTFYTDVQEICEEVFGEYMSPLQGLTGILISYGKQYRTDRETAVIGPDRAEFYLFLQDAVALAVIEDKGDSYRTTFRILKEEEAKGIRVLQIPPLGGIGIAGTAHRPESPNYDTHTMVTYEGETEYTKADIQFVFNEYVQTIAEISFGNYVESLQGLYALTEQEGYGHTWDFSVEDKISPWIEEALGHEEEHETTLAEKDYCEFTLLLGGLDRARVTIKREGSQYTTTFRFLKDGECETTPHGG